MDPYVNQGYYGADPYENSTEASQYYPESSSVFNDNSIPITLSWVRIVGDDSSGFDENEYQYDESSGQYYYVGDPFSKKTEDGSTRILDNANGIVKPGQLCAIMGASGAGKTTLLNVLNFRNQGKMKIDGDIRVNGRTATWQEITKYSAYVQQQDLYIGTMTVREHLTFLAFLKMGRNATTEQKYARIDEVISQVNLVKAENNYIGVGDMLKGISGGEKRRLAFASEIMTNPSLLFCDEPTSGLDASMAIGLVDIMLDLVNRGKTVVCTIHQPSSEIFEKFDTLCLLSEGRTAFFGPTQEAISFFANLGYVCPKTYNPPDFYIETLAITSTNREGSLLKSKAICDAFQQSQYQVAVLNETAQITSQGESLGYDEFSHLDRYSAHWYTQVKWLLWRNFINDFRQPVATKILLFQVLFVGIFFGLIYLNIKLDEKGIQNTNGLLLILMMNMGFVFLFPVLNVFLGEVPIVYRENKNRMYSVVYYYLTKQIADLPKYIVLAFILGTITYWMANVRNDAGVYISVVLLLILLSQTSTSFAYFLSAISPSLDFATAVAGPILIPLILFAGFFLNNSSTPDYFIWLKYISWFYYTYDSLLIKVWSSIGSIECSEPIIDGCPNKFCKNSGMDVLNDYKINPDNLTKNILLNIVILVALRVIGFIVFYIKFKLR